MPNITVHCQNNTQNIEVKEGENVHAALMQAGFKDGGVCGKGSCGLCRVSVHSKQQPTEKEIEHLGTMMHLMDDRLACQIMVVDGMTVRLKAK